MPLGGTRSELLATQYGLRDRSSDSTDPRGCHRFSSAKEWKRRKSTGHWKVVFEKPVYPDLDTVPESNSRDSLSNCNSSSHRSSRLEHCLSKDESSLQPIVFGEPSKKGAANKSELGLFGSLLNSGIIDSSERSMVLRSAKETNAPIQMRKPELHPETKQKKQIQTAKATKPRGRAKQHKETENLKLPRDLDQKENTDANASEQIKENSELRRLAAHFDSLEKDELKIEKCAAQTIEDGDPAKSEPVFSEDFATHFSSPLSDSSPEHESFVSEHPVRRALRTANIVSTSTPERENPIELKTPALKVEPSRNERNARAKGVSPIPFVDPLCEFENAEQAPSSPVTKRDTSTICSILAQRNVTIERRKHEANSSFLFFTPDLTPKTISRVTKPSVQTGSAARISPQRALTDFPSETSSKLSVETAPESDIEVFDKEDPGSGMSSQSESLDKHDSSVATENERVFDNMDPGAGMSVSGKILEKLDSSVAAENDRVFDNKDPGAGMSKMDGNLEKEESFVSPANRTNDLREKNDEFSAAERASSEGDISNEEDTGTDGGILPSTPSPSRFTPSSQEAASPSKHRRVSAMSSPLSHYADACSSTPHSKAPNSDSERFAETSEVLSMFSSLSVNSENSRDVTGSSIASTNATGVKARNFSRLETAENMTPYYVRGRGQERTPMGDLLAVCEQDRLLSWTEAFSADMIKKSKKIGEGVYGEVFRSFYRDKTSVAIKVIPIEGTFDVNGTAQKSFDEILPEVVIAKEMSGLREATDNRTPNFVEVLESRVIAGSYPPSLLRAWTQFANSKGSENDDPRIFGEEQLFLVFVFGDGGCDLENFKIKNEKQAGSIAVQVLLALSAAEQAVEFEHRDLHIGNVLVKETPQPSVSYRIEGRDIDVATHGVEVFIIDFTNSRLKKNGCYIYFDLSTDQELFEGPENERQFEVYRIMQKENNDEWKSFNPHSNVLWFHYIVDKLIKLKKFPGKRNKGLYSELRQEIDGILSFGSCSQILNQDCFWPSLSITN